MKIRWSREAASDLEKIAEFIARHKPAAAEDVINRIYSRIADIPEFPHLGRAGRTPGSREPGLSPMPFVVVYRLRGGALEISSIWHGAQSRTR